MERDLENLGSELWNGDEENTGVVYREDYGDENLDLMWDRKRREAVSHVVAYGAYLVSLISIYHQSKKLSRVTQKESLDAFMARERRRFQLMNALQVTRTCGENGELVVNIGKRKNIEAPSSIKWTVCMDKVFIDALMNEVACGNRVDGQFTSQAYENIIKVCTEKLDLPFTKDHLKNRLKTIKSKFNEVIDLFGADGWRWNEETEMFDNEDEVWESLLEKKPEAKKWKNKPFHQFDLLAKLFLKAQATGDDSSIPKEKRLHMASTVAELSDKYESKVEVKTGDLKDSTVSKKGKRKAIEEILREEILTIKQGLDNVAQALREGNNVIEKGRPQVYTAQEIFEELSRMALNPVIRRKAYRFLNAKQARVRELFGYPLDKRKEFLMEMMIEEGV